VDDAREGSQRHFFMICPFLPAKSSHVGVNVDGLACPLHLPMACNRQMRGRVFMSGAALSHHVGTGGGIFLGDAKHLDLDICWGVDHLGTCVIEFLRWTYCFYQCTLTLRLSHRGVHVHIPDRATISDSDEMDPGTQVYAVRCTWPLAAMSYLFRQRVLSPHEALMLDVLIR
jgi:hypothetical protein